MQLPGKTLIIVMLVVAPLSGFGRAQAAEFPESKEWWRTATPSQIERLLADGADIHAWNKYGWTPLHAAAQFNENSEVIEALLHAGADPKLKDSYGKLPADYTAKNKRIKNSKVHWLLHEAHY